MPLTLSHRLFPLVAFEEQEAARLYPKCMCVYINVCVALWF